MIFFLSNQITLYLDEFGDCLSLEVFKHWQSSDFNRLFGDLKWRCKFSNSAQPIESTFGYDYEQRTSFYTTIGKDGPQPFWDHSPNEYRPNIDNIVDEINTREDIHPEYKNQIIGFLRTLPLTYS